MSAIGPSGHGLVHRTCPLMTQSADIGLGSNSISPREYWSLSLHDPWQPITAQRPSHGEKRQVKKSSVASAPCSPRTTSRGLRYLLASESKRSDVSDRGRRPTGKLHVRRAKGGTASVHPLGGRELRALRRLKREAPASVYVFVSERLAPLSVAGYQRMVARAGEAAGFPFLVHSHMLRHSCGYKLANDGPRHPGDPALPRAQVDQLDRPLYGSGA